MERITSHKPVEAAAEALATQLRKYADRPILLMLSGGSAFAIYEHLIPELFGEHVSFCVMDERCSADTEASNTERLKTTALYQAATTAGATFIEVNGKEPEHCADHATTWELALQTWQTANPSGVILATLGIGTDGHTAGILPHAPEEVFEGERWTASFTVEGSENEYPSRITATPYFLRSQVHYAVLFAVGENKQEILKRLDERPDVSLREFPALVIHDMQAVTLITNSGT